MLTEIKKATVTCHLPGNFSEKAHNEFIAELKQKCNNNTKKVVIDCAQVEMGISGHIGMLWEAKSYCDNISVELVLRSVTLGLLRVLKVLDLFDLFIDDEPTITFDPSREKVSDQSKITESFFLEFKAEANNITRSLEQFHRYLKKMNVSEDLMIELETVFYEVATNIYLHGKVDNFQGVKFSMDQVDNYLVLKFVDQGLAFDPTVRIQELNPQTAMKKHQKRGFGLYMISKMTDKISYCRRDNRYNELILEKKRR
jgi:anti-sigma regulatory factor (Ser/Thr protein kinase)/anti-anti-sigma regulatory factor